MPWHLKRALFFMTGFLVLYCIWIALMLRFNWMAIWVGLIPLPFAAAYDLSLRLRWKPEIVTLYPPPPSLFDRLIERPYGVYWPPVLFPIPVWLSVVSLLLFLSASSFLTPASAAAEVPGVSSCISHPTT